MATAIPVKVYRGLSNATPALAYTVPAGASLVITSVVVANKSAATKWVALEVEGITLIHAKPVAANDTYSLDCKQVVDEGGTVYVQGQDNTLNIHVSGVLLYS